MTETLGKSTLAKPDEVGKDMTDQDNPFDEDEHKEFSKWFLEYENEFGSVNRPKLKAKRRKMEKSEELMIKDLKK